MCGPKCGVCAACGKHGPGDRTCPVHRGKNCGDISPSFDGHHSHPALMDALWREAKRRWPGVAEAVEAAIKRGIEEPVPPRRGKP